MILFTWAEKSHNSLRPRSGNVFLRVRDNICVQQQVFWWEKNILGIIFFVKCLLIKRGLDINPT